MANFKCSILVNATAGGFSDQFYYNSSDIGGAIAAVGALAPLRAACLPLGSRVMGFRISDVGNPGNTTLRTLVARGSGAFAQDITNVSVRTRMFSGLALKRTLWIKNVPDRVVIDGRFVDVNGWLTRLTTFLQRLVDLGFRMRVYDRLNLLKEYDSVSNIGLIHFATAPGFATDNKVRFFRSRLSTGKAIRGSFRVVATTDAKEFLLAGWRSGDTAGPGKLRKIEIAYAPFTGYETALTAGTHKIGRSFFSPVGRASTRR